VRESRHLGVLQPSVNVHVVGLGAVGTVLAAALAAAGFRVHTYKAGANDGAPLVVASPAHTQLTDVTWHGTDLPTVGDSDAVVVAVKWPYLERVIDTLAPRLTQSNPIILPQNGLVDECVRAPFRCIPIVVHASAHVHTRGRVTIHTGPAFLVREMDHALPEELLRRAGFVALDNDAFAVAQRVKLLTASLSLKIALAGVTIGDAFSDRVFRNELVALVREGQRVFLADEPGDLNLITATDVLVDRVSTGQLVDSLAMHEAYPSLHYDLNVHRRTTEAAWLNGYIVRLGASMGIRTPLNIGILAELTAREALLLSPETPT